MSSKSRTKLISTWREGYGWSRLSKALWKLSRMMSHNLETMWLRWLTSMTWTILRVRNWRNKWYRLSSLKRLTKILKSNHLPSLLMTKTISRKYSRFKIIRKASFQCYQRVMNRLIKLSKALKKNRLDMYRRSIIFSLLVSIN